MEKIDILALSFGIFVIIISCYICYLKAGINFLVEELVKHHIILEKLLESSEAQNKINTAQYEINAAQDKYNTTINQLLTKLINGSSPTGGEK